MKKEWQWMREDHPSSVESQIKYKSKMIKCNMCSEDLIWGADHSYEDYGAEGEGIVGNYSCSNEDCSVEEILIFTKL